MKRLQFILFFSLSFIILLAQSPKREMRATWLATVWQIDWPGSVISSTGNASEIATQKKAMIRILDSLASANMNAVCFQVRSRCDAMYQSSYEPWSTDLVATRGMNPGYDPLAFVIEEGHKRGIEVHAWLNPYRYESSVNQWTGANDYRAAHPDWLLTYASGTSILDPGNPAVVERIKDIVGEIVHNYDVDGILFDDYFYAYGGTPSSLDANSQKLYKPANLSLDDWRRANVNKMVAAVYDTIQLLKPYVKFGVSPFGIWTTDENVAVKEGIEIPGVSGANMYAEIYCDPVAWLKQGKVDYISPQLYWGTGGAQDYGTLCPWWSTIANKFGKHFYSSQDLEGLSTSNYAPAMRYSKRNTLVEMNGQKVNLNAMTQIERKSATSKPIRAVAAGNFAQEEIGKQISVNRSADENGAPGSIFFSTKQLYLTKGFINYLKKFQFTQKALTPAIDWKQRPEYGMVSNMILNGTTLSWISLAPNVRYTVYAIPNNQLSLVGNFSTSKNLLGITYSTSFIIPKTISTSTHTFAVAVLDRFGNEFSPQLLDQSQGIPSIVNLISPENGEQKILPFNFSWQDDPSAELYLFEVAEDENFTKPVCSRELIVNSFSSTQLDILQSDKTYYWRVKTRKPNASDGVSVVRSFIPQRFSMLLPLTGATNVSLTPNITWQNVNTGNAYLLEIATGSQFTQSSIVYSTTVSTPGFTVPQHVLSESTTYYVRVSADILGVKTITNVINFSTLTIVPDVPVFLTPANNSTLSGTQIKVVWTEGFTSGYRVEMSKVATFPPRNIDINIVDAYVYETTYAGLTPADYYFRIRANYSGSLYTAWSDVLKIVLSDGTGISELKAGTVNCSIMKNNDSELLVKLVTPEAVRATVYLLSLSGVQLKQICQNQPLSVGSNLFSVPVENLPLGVYLLVVKTDAGQCVLKYIR